MKKTRITSLFKIDLPIIQAGMVWCSGWRLASATSNSGGLGIIGSGSMYPETLQEHIVKCKQATNKPFAINLPLIYPDIDKHIDIIIKEGVKIVFTSAGNPKKFTSILKKHGIIVVHVVSSSTFALKAQDAGVDAIVAEGFEAGGHNGREETTTLCLIPPVVDTVNIPVIAAGGIASGRAIAATMMLGAEAVQIGSLFATSKESSAHINFKDQVINATEGDTLLSLKKLVPVRLLKNNFQQEVFDQENQGADADKLKALLGRGRSKKGIFEGDIINGELEIGQAASQIQNIKSVKEIIQELIDEYNSTIESF